MRSTLKVVTPADDVSLMTVYEAKVNLKITSDTDDELIEQIVRTQSAVVASMCNRTLAKETVIESFYDVPDTSGSIYLSRWPIRSIDSINDDGPIYVDVDYDYDEQSGRLSLLNYGYWGSPVAVQYTGGYLLPFEAPNALKQAMVLLVREAYYQAARGDASVRMIGHKESRVIYFDPNARTSASGAQSSLANAGSAAQKAAMQIVRKFMRFEV